jgi:hypothetical protein
MKEETDKPYRLLFAISPVVYTAGFFMCGNKHPMANNFCHEEFSTQKRLFLIPRVEAGK